MTMVLEWTTQEGVSVLPISVHSPRDLQLILQLLFWHSYVETKAGVYHV